MEEGKPEVAASVYVRYEGKMVDKPGRGRGGGWQQARAIVLYTTISVHIGRLLCMKSYEILRDLGSQVPSILNPM